MKDYTQYKRLTKCLSSSIIVVLEVGLYWIVWNDYYNTIIEFPFWRRGNWLIVSLYAVLLLFFLKTYGGFKIGLLKKGNVIYSQILSICFVNAITYFQISLIDKKFHALTAIVLLTAVDIVVIFLWAFTFQYVYGRMFPQKRLLLVYGDIPAFHLLDKINSREDKYQICGAIHIREGVDRVMEAALDFDAIIIGDIPSHERNKLLKLCFSVSIRTYSVPKISDILLKSSDELNIFDSPLLLSRNEGLQIEQRVIKRALDIVLSAIGLILTSPFFLFITILIKCSDKGPVFYRQKRLTMHGKIFEIYKFRTMIQNAEEESGICLACEHDSRILPVGKMLRATRLDELPQLYNILKGDMSLVGPRPERPELAEQIEKEIPEFADRLKVKAGLTGYAQVYGKYNTTSYDKIKLDLTYIRKYSVWMDIRLMLMTPKIMLLKESTEGIKKDNVSEDDLKEIALTKEWKD